ncbi:MAG: DUF2807 domain-containing protein [Bacteroidales bacterium]|nr:MAG: DUF2807 domain-containing protein [Bacteroidales bacterium]
MNKLILIITFLLILYSCEKESSNCLFRNGSIIKKEILLDDFSSIEVYDIFNLILIQDTISRIVLEGGENLLPHVETSIKDDTLKISHSIRCIWLRDYEKINIYIHFSRLDRIVADAPVKIISTDTLTCSNLEYYAIGEIGEADMILNCNYFRFDGSYSTLGHFRFKGKSDKSRFYVNYGSSLFADSLISKQADVYFKTIGDIHVHVTEHLRVWIWGSGNVYYSGDPGKVEIMENRSTGRLIKAD